MDLQGLTDAATVRRRVEAELSLPAPLLPYQWEGVAFLCRSSAALLADEMGLGKTVQAAVALALLLNGKPEVRRVLIVAPASLTLNWMEEVERWAPSVTVRRLVGDARDRAAWYLLPVPVLVGSYEQIRADGLERIPRGAFDLVILDEAQRIKNEASRTSLACRLLPRERAWALSATPLENREEDLRSLLAFLEVEAAQGAPNEVSAALEEVMLRRRKSEVRADLPPVIVQDVRVEMEGPQRARYEEMWVHREEGLEEGRSRTETRAILLGLITRLKAVCNFDGPTGCSAKMDGLETVIDGTGPGARILVFSQFVRTLRWISDKLRVPHGLVVGPMKMEARQAAMRDFRSKPSPRVLLVSLRAGGVGLNLGEATHVVMFDRWWNSAVESQAIYRAHRHDRSDPLHVIRFLTVDSIEERIAAIIERKASLFEDLVNAAGYRRRTHQSLTEADLRYMLDLVATGPGLDCPSTAS